MSRSSCREHDINGSNMEGYFRGVREFFPRGTFDELNDFYVSTDPTWVNSTCSPNLEFVSELSRLRFRIRRLKLEIEEVSSYLSNLSGNTQYKMKVGHKLLEELSFLHKELENCVCELSSLENMF